MTQPIFTALIGYGFAGKTFHAPLIRAVNGLNLAMVASTDPAKVHADFPQAQVIADPFAVATHPDVALVVIASPNESHFPLAMAALAAGKHVVVDKPFTLTVAEAEQLAQAAKASKTQLSVFHNRRWDADFLALKQVLATGCLGEIVHFESHFDRFRPLVRDRWREQAGPGSGLWFDLGPHLIDQALQLFGLPDTVSADFALQRDHAAAVDWCHVVLGYPRLRVVLHASALVAGGVPRFAIHGKAGSLIKFGLDVQEDQLKAGGTPHDAGFGVDPTPYTLFQNEQTHAHPCPVGNYLHYYQAVYASIREGGPNPVPASEAIAVMRVLACALSAATQGRTLTL